MSLLIDADYIVYKCCAAAEIDLDFGNDVIVVQSKFSDAMRMVERDLYNIANDIGIFDNSILFFSDSTNFRKCIDPEYKGHRNRKKPCGYRRVIERLKEDYQVEVMPSLEADDALGIWATKEEGHIICSPDKDMKQIPGDLYNFNDAVTTITEEEADHWHLIQTLAGDQTDGYSGVPGYGIKRAESHFKASGYNWRSVVKAFEEKDLTEDDALRNARLARILRHTDYDFEQQIPRLWTPAAASNDADA